MRTINVSREKMYCPRCNAHLTKIYIDHNDVTFLEPDGYTLAKFKCKDCDLDIVGRYSFAPMFMYDPDDPTYSKGGNNGEVI